MRIRLEYKLKNCSSWSLMGKDQRPAEFVLVPV